MERNLRLLVAYDGTAYHGWQHQPGLPTIQGMLEQSARRVLRHQVVIIGSGRTDAGVHAYGQTAHLFTDSQIPAYKLKRAIGSRLPKDITLREVTDVSPSFHATQSSLSKMYRYCIHARPNRPVDRLRQRYCYHYWHPLDIERMQAAAAYFIGTMDFSAMASAGCRRETMVRTVLRCDVYRHYDEIRIEVQGKGFLYNQVRNMVGTLIEVGRGHWEPDHVAEILDSLDRRNAGPTVPARGLCLQWVHYPGHILVPPKRESPINEANEDQGEDWWGAEPASGGR